MFLKEAGLELARKIMPFSAPDSYTAPQHLHETGAFLQPHHVAEIKSDSSLVHWRELRGEERIKGIGHIRRVGFTTEQGYSYSAIIGVPEQPESNVPIIGTSAWFTSTEGHNEHTIRNMMRAGNYVYFIGAEGSYQPDDRAPAEPVSPISLSNSAAGVLNFAYHTTRELQAEGYDIASRERIAIGESRGAMVAMGITALAEEFQQEVIMADLVAPCLPRAMRSADIHHLVEQLVKEPIEITRLIGRMTLGRALHYPATFDPSPYSVKHQIALGFALFSGEAGMLAEHIPPKTLMHITTFNGDFASMPEEWERIFTDHQNVRITPLRGSHLTLADLETLQYIIGRNKAAQQCIAEGTPLSPETVFTAAHILAPDQIPLPYAA